MRKLRSFLSPAEQQVIVLNARHHFFSVPFPSSTIFRLYFTADHYSIIVEHNCRTFASPVIGEKCIANSKVYFYI